MLLLAPPALQVSATKDPSPAHLLEAYGRKDDRALQQMAGQARSAGTRVLGGYLRLRLGTLSEHRWAMDFPRDPAVLGRLWFDRTMNNPRLEIVDESGDRRTLGYPLIADRLYRIAAKGDEVALDRFLGWVDQSDGEVFEYFTTSLVDLFLHHSDVVLAQWPLIRQYRARLEGFTGADVSQAQVDALRALYRKLLTAKDSRRKEILACFADSEA